MDNLGKERENPKNTWSMTKKDHQKFCRENGIFFRNFVRKMFSSPPQTRRQVSATVYFK